MFAKYICWLSVSSLNEFAKKTNCYEKYDFCKTFKVWWKTTISAKFAVFSSLIQDGISTGIGILAGVTSWGYACGQPRRPGIYSNVNHFYNNNWLQNTFEKLNGMKEFNDCDTG